MATENSGQNTPFLGGGDRPSVHTLLDRPIRDLTPRQLSAVFAALGMPSGPAGSRDGAPIGGDPVDVPGEELPEDPCAWDVEFERERILAELAEQGAPIEALRQMDMEELIIEAQNYNISAASLASLKSIKTIIDKIRRDKPTVDKAIKDAKTAGDKIIKDNKPTVDKVIKDGKTVVDKTIRDKGVTKDAKDLKNVKDIVDMFAVVPVDQPVLGELTKQVEALRAQFEQIAQSIEKLDANQGS